MSDTVIAFVGDPHGQWDVIRRDIHSHLRSDIPIAAIIPVGDMELSNPIEQELAEFLDLGIAVHWIPGNHDAENTRWYDNLFNSEIADRNLHATCARIGNAQVAGLGGVFRGKIWFPRHGNDPVHYHSRDGLLADCRTPERWRKGLPLRHRASIFPEDFEKLRSHAADILVCHEAPSSMVSHRNGEMIGFEAIDHLAGEMNVKLIVHGHHHHSYSAQIKNGVHVRGLAKAEVWLWPERK